MTQTAEQYAVHTAGTKLSYEVNGFATNTQITLGTSASARLSSGVTVIRSRPYLGSRPVDAALADFENSGVASISFPAVSGVTTHTITILDKRLSYVQVDDTGNGSLGDFWVHICQW